MAYPRGLPTNYRDLWDHPWKLRARKNPGFRKWLDRNGYLSPHFTKAEARCKDPQRTPVPKNLLKRARDHAFNVERLRHRLGDKPIPTLSWYRTPAWNRHVGGAGNSRHTYADACDIDVQTVRSLPGFDREAEKVFAKGGFGTYPGGNRHVDSRGWRARWSSWTPGS